MNDEVWKDASVAQRFLQGVRGGLPFAKEQLDILIRLIEANGKPVRAFADLGCGSGVVAAAILARFPRAQATLVDFSPPMLEQARAQFENHSRRVRFVAADLGERAWMKAVKSRAPFDVIASGFCIHHQPDKRKRELYAEIFELLRPGGIFVNIEHVSSPTRWVEAVSDELMIDSIHQFHRGTKSRAQVAEEFVHRPDKAANILAPVEAQCRWLRACGFEDVDCYFKAFALAVFGGRRPASR